VKEKNKWFVYILKCSDDTFYTGATNNIERRIIKHNKGKASKYTRSRLPVKLVYKEEVNNCSLAYSREYYIKILNRKEKQNLIKEWEKYDEQNKQNI